MRETKKKSKYLKTSCIDKQTMAWLKIIVNILEISLCVIDTPKIRLKFIHCMW